MKKNDIIALHQKSIDELKQELVKLEQELGKAKLEIKAGKRKNTHSRLMADHIARIKTIIGEKTRAEAVKPAKETGDKS